MKIFAVDQNYQFHNLEMNIQYPDIPIIFMKPDSSVLKDNKPFFLPNFSKNIDYEVELIIKINKIGKNINPKFAHRYFDEVGLGIDFTARDLQRQLQSEGKPWEICKGFDGATILGQFYDKSQFKNIQDIDFCLEKNNECVQKGNSKDMIFTISEIISYISQFFTLKIGDIIFTGTPKGSGKVNIGDKLKGYIAGSEAFDFYVK